MSDLSDKTIQAYDGLLTGLLQAYSPSHQERPASEYLASWMQSAGYDRAFVDDAGNAVGILGDGPREIVLLGHIDTVSGKIDVQIIDGKLYGRGSVDAKGPLATFTAAALQAGRQPGWRIVVIGAVEEEAATSKGARFAYWRAEPVGSVDAWLQRPLAAGLPRITHFEPHRRACAYRP